MEKDPYFGQLALMEGNQFTQSTHTLNDDINSTDETSNPNVVLDQQLKAYKNQYKDPSQELEIVDETNSDMFLGISHKMDDNQQMNTIIISPPTESMKFRIIPQPTQNATFSSQSQKSNKISAAIKNHYDLSSSLT